MSFMPLRNLPLLACAKHNLTGPQAQYHNFNPKNLPLISVPSVWTLAHLSRWMALKTDVWGWQLAPHAHPDPIYSIQVAWGGQQGNRLFCQPLTLQLLVCVCVCVSKTRTGMHPLSHTKMLRHATMAQMQSVLAPQCNVTPCPQRILCCEEGVSLQLLLKSIPPWREGLWLPKIGTNQVFDLQKRKPTCIPRSLYWRRTTCQLWRWVRVFLDGPERTGKRLTLDISSIHTAELQNTYTSRLLAKNIFKIKRRK